MKKCPYCGYENKDNTEICAHCFANLLQETEREQEEQKSAPNKK